MKKYLKIIGNVIMIITLIFIAKKLIDMDIDPSQFRSVGVIGALAEVTAIQTVICIMACYPWLVFTNSLSGQKIPFSAAMPVYTQSNLYKYLPGNVLQYVGRNTLAAKENISHVDVACATILDILFCVLGTCIISAVLLGSLIGSLAEKYGKQFIMVGAVGIIFIIVITVIIKLKFSEKVKIYLSRYSKALEKKNRVQLAKGILYYIVQNCISAAMYFIALKLIFGSAADFKEIVSYTGAFLFAWIIGFITIGAPGGIGIRESVMMFVCGDKYADKIILFVLVMRIASTFADVIAFIIGKIYIKTKNP